MRVEKEEAEQTERPFAYADPRSLSQAWYDALYGSRQGPHHARSRDDASHDAARNTSSSSTAPSVAGARDERDLRDPNVLAIDARSDEAVARAAMTRDADRSARASANAAAAARTMRPAPTLSRNDVELRDSDGREIRLLLAQHGERVDVVAVTDPAAVGRVAEALESARLALAARGIGITSRVEERGER